jgi:hypothetical protein
VRTAPAASLRFLHFWRLLPFVVARLVAPLLAITLVVGVGGGCRAGRPKRLFDGATLAGWAGAAYWNVKDGAIHFEGDAGPGTLLLSDDDYSDFRLTMQSRLLSPENHLGVCFWGNRRADFGYGDCILVIPPNGGMWDYHPGKKGPPRQKLADPRFDPHQWHRTEILARRSTGEIRMAVNGIELLRYKDEDPTRLKHGPIGLQAHAGYSEVEYKDLLVELAPKEDRLLTVTNR